MPLEPTVVRKMILDEHSLIRSKLAALEKLMAEKQDQAIKVAVEEFNGFFLNHLATEEEILLPILQAVDAWGDVRVERMNKEHIEQTHELKRLNALVQGAGFVEYEKALQLFVQSIYKDMAHEEKDFLSAELLKDDVITIGNYR